MRIDKRGNLRSCLVITAVSGNGVEFQQNSAGNHFINGKKVSKAAYLKKAKKERFGRQ